MKEDNLCPVCGEDALKQTEYSLSLEFKGKESLVDGFLRSVCESCESETTNPEQSLHNKRMTLAARKEAESFLSGERVRAIRHGYGLTQHLAATIFGGGSVAFSKYEKDDVVQSTSMDRLLRVAEAVPAAYNWLLNYVGTTTNELNELLDETEWEYSEEKIWDATGHKKNKKGNALHIQYEEVPFFCESTLAANGNDDCYETDKEPLSA